MQLLALVKLANHTAKSAVIFLTLMVLVAETPPMHAKPDGEAVLWHKSTTVNLYTEGFIFTVKTIIYTSCNYFTHLVYQELACQCPSCQAT